MRWLFWLLLLALAAAGVAMLLQVNAGNVAFLLPPWRVDVSLNLFLVALALLLGMVWWFARGLQKIADFPDRVRRYRERREQLTSHQSLREAVRSLLEGRFARAETAARSAQQAPELAGVAALVGARAAHRMQEYGRRDEWLERAGRDADLATAVLVSSAEMWTEQREHGLALGAIGRLKSAGARHLFATRIALNAHLQAGHWDEALRALRVLDKRKALTPLVATHLAISIQRRLLESRRHDPAGLEAAWAAVPADEQKLPELALAAARLLNLAGRGGLAAAAIEGALAMPTPRWDAAAAALLDEYALAQSFPARAQMERVEHWLAHPPPDTAAHAALLRCAGLLCLREQLWGKARGALQDSLTLQSDPATMLALARLAEAVGDEALAAVHYREAALAYAHAAADRAAADVAGRLGNAREGTL